jgi:hypothetical protein
MRTPKGRVGVLTRQMRTGLYYGHESFNGCPASAFAGGWRRAKHLACSDAVLREVQLAAVAGGRYGNLRFPSGPYGNLSLRPFLTVRAYISSMAIRFSLRDAFLLWTFVALVCFVFVSDPTQASGNIHRDVNDSNA